MCEAEDGFEDLIWTDECNVQMEGRQRFCCRKRGKAPKNKPQIKERRAYRDGIRGKGDKIGMVSVVSS